MKRTFTIEFDTDAPASAIELILKDALGEFIRARSPVDGYVAERYKGQTPKWRSDKAARVADRIDIAKKLLPAFDDMIEEKEDE